MSVSKLRKRIAREERRPYPLVSSCERAFPEPRVGKSDDPRWRIQHIRIHKSRNLLIPHDGHPRAF